MPLDSRNSEMPVHGLMIDQEAAGLDAQIIDLTDRAFGPGRYVKTAERLREGMTPLAGLSFVARDGDRVVASVRQWAIRVSDEAAGISETIAFLGPIVVDEAQRGTGLGKQLMRLSLQAAAKAGFRAVLLVGDAAYFQPVGFEVAAGITLPGPADPRRVLIHYTTSGDRLTGAVTRNDAV